MRKTLHFGLLLLAFAACNRKPAGPSAGVATPAAAIHGFYTWYDAFLRDTTRSINFTDDRGPHLKLDPAKFDQYFQNLKASGFLSDEYIAAEKAFFRKCETYWQHEEKGDVPTGMDEDRLFCAQDWDLNFWTKSPVSIAPLDSNRVAATMSGTEGGSPKTHDFELVKEGGKWLIAKIACDFEFPQGYTGTYKSTDATCPMLLDITQRDGAYRYSIKTSKQKREGLIEVNESEGSTYFLFKGLLGNSPKAEVEALFDDGTIRIQNAGNASNQYLRFKECDTKYIELAKQTATAAAAAAPTTYANESRIAAPSVEKAEQAEKPELKTAKAATKTAAAKVSPPPSLPTVTVNRNGEIALSGKKTTIENLRKDLQAALLTFSVIPDELRLKSIGEVGMGTRHEVQTLINEAIAGAKWSRKKAAIAALNSPVSKKLGLATELAIKHFETSGSFALIDARPTQVGGAAIDYSQTAYKKEAQAGTFSDRAIGLLKYEKGAWKVLIYTLGTDKASTNTWPKKFGAPKSLFAKL
ncbi:MAG: DUF3828 domain-containing protein [Saprospiraceae bacterium]